MPSFWVVARVLIFLSFLFVLWRLGLPVPLRTLLTLFIRVLRALSYFTLLLVLRLPGIRPAGVIWIPFCPRIVSIIRIAAFTFLRARIRDIFASVVHQRICLREIWRSHKISFGELIFVVAMRLLEILIELDGRVGNDLEMLPCQDQRE